MALTTINAGDQRRRHRARTARRAAAIAHVGIADSDSALVRIDFDPEDAPGELHLRTAVSARAARCAPCLGECRALDARDFLPAAGGKATTVCGGQEQSGGLRRAPNCALRVQAVIATALTTLADQLDGPRPPNVTLTLLHDAADDAGDDETVHRQARRCVREARRRRASTSPIPRRCRPRSRCSTRRQLAVDVAGGRAVRHHRCVPAGDRSHRTRCREPLAAVARATRGAPPAQCAKPADGVLDRAAALIAAARRTSPSTDQVSSLLQAGADPVRGYVQVPAAVHLLQRGRPRRGGQRAARSCCRSRLRQGAGARARRARRRVVAGRGARAAAHEHLGDSARARRRAQR